MSKEKKSIVSKIIDKLDQKLKDKSAKTDGSCCGPDSKDGSGSCCS
jgi:hypothetical protein